MQSSKPSGRLVAVKRSLDGYTSALFDDNYATFVAFGLVIAIWALELVMNLQKHAGFQ